MSGFGIVRALHMTRRLNAANAVSTQSRIMRKLLGSKKSGSKKKWFAGEFNGQSEANIVSAQNMIKTEKGGKNATRRMMVLNKLFMKYITDLMAAGTVSSQIVGKGVEVSRVKVSSDFRAVNVYWVARGTTDDVQVESTLQKSAGHIRHELSQLRLMGEVPRIHFVMDKTYANLIEVGTILDKCDFDDESRVFSESDQMKRDLHLNVTDYEPVTDGDENEEKVQIQAMKHDVLGLNHYLIMDKILVKMKKSTDAWKQYEQKGSAIAADLVELGDLAKRTTDALAVAQLNDDKFQKFLQKRKQVKKSKDHRDRSDLLDLYQEELRSRSGGDYDEPNEQEERDFIEEHDK